MEFRKIEGTEAKTSRIGLGTWAIGGSEWGGTDEKKSIDTILTALDKGINFIDTAFAYGAGKSEEIIGKALKEYGNREDIVLATKTALEKRDGEAIRNSSKERIIKEVDDSLQRLQVEYIDLYQVHWPDPLVPIEETAEVMKQLKDEGKIRFPGVSNYSVDDMEKFSQVTRLHSNQMPYNLLERGIEENVIPYCVKNDVSLIAYGALCRGLLSGKMNKERNFGEGDIRNVDPKFQEPRFDQYLRAVDEIEKFSRENYDKSVLAFSVRWILDMGIDFALWGARKPEQLDVIKEIFGWQIDDAGKIFIDNILKETIKDPVGPEFMAPGTRKED